jgi:hypothetical protein
LPKNTIYPKKYYLENLEISKFYFTLCSNKNYMPQIGTLTTGAGVETVFAGQASCPASIVIGDIGTANALSGIQIEVDGVPFVNIKGNATLANAFAKWGNSTINGTGVIGLAYHVATGKINRNTTIRLTNSGVTTPAVRVFSDNQNGVPFIAAQKGINPNSFEDFSKFSALIIDVPANINNIEVNFLDGHRETWTVQDADSYFAITNQAEANGRLGGCTVIDNTTQAIESVRVNCGGTAVTVLVIKLPDAAFNVLAGK